MSGTGGGTGLRGAAPAGTGGGAALLGATPAGTGGRACVIGALATGGACSVAGIRSPMSFSKNVDTCRCDKEKRYFAAISSNAS